MEGLHHDTDIDHLAPTPRDKLESSGDEPSGAESDDSINSSKNESFASDSINQGLSPEDKIELYENFKVEAEDILDDLEHYIDVTKEREHKHELELEREREGEAEEKKLAREAEEKKHQIEVEKLAAEDRERERQYQLGMEMHSTAIMTVSKMAVVSTFIETVQHCVHCLMVTM